MAMSGLFLFLGGCQRDEKDVPSISKEISLEEIIAHCASINNQGVSLRTNNRTPLNVLPDFSTLVRSTNQFGDPVFIGYLDKYSLDSIIRPAPFEGALIAFFKDSIGDLRIELMLCKQKPDTHFDKTFFLIYPQSNFSGINILINDFNRAEKIGAYQNGILTKTKNLTLIYRNGNVYDYQRTQVICNCDNGCYLSPWCSFLCGINAFLSAVVHESGNAINWLGEQFSNIYYWWADGEWKKDTWKGEPGPGGTGFSGGSWGGTWGDSGGHGGTSFSNDRDWGNEKLKCLLQQFNDLEGNGETSNLNFPELCTLHSLLQLGDCEYKMLYNDQALVSNIMAFLKNKNNAPSAVAIVKKALLTACISPNGGNDLNSYLNCALKNQNINLDFDKFMASYKVIEEFLNDLINPCKGKAIDKDEIFSRLCTSGEMSLAGLVNTIKLEVCNQSCGGIILDVNSSCEGLIDRYVPCSEVIFTKKGLKTFAQMEIDNYALALCIPPPLDEEADDAIMGGLLRSVNLKVEIELPSYMIYSTFGYTNSQTRVAQFLSAAMQYPSDIVPPLNSCDQLGTLRLQFRNGFFSFLDNNENKIEFFGTEFVNEIKFRKNFQESGVIPEKAAPSFLSSVTDCD